jgi:hypothetical protein
LSVFLGAFFVRRFNGNGGITVAGRLARDHEHALVSRPHVQLHLAKCLQGYCRRCSTCTARWTVATKPSTRSIRASPSGTAKDWGNLEYDVNIMLYDMSSGRTATTGLDIFNFDGFPRTS